MIDSTKDKNSRYLVYTCVFGGYDTVLYPLTVEENIDYIIITDNPKMRVDGWHTMVVNSNDYPTFKAANLHYRALIHRYLKDYDISLYVDGNIRLIGRVSEVISEFEHSQCALGVYSHISRCTVKDEIVACLEQKKVHNPENLQEEYDYFLMNGFKDDQGLIETAVILKNHKSSQLDFAMYQWWSIYSRYLGRDQISLPFVKWLTNISCYYFEKSYRLKNEYFFQYPHKNDTRFSELYRRFVPRKHEGIHFELLSSFFAMSHRLKGMMGNKSS